MKELDKSEGLKDCPLKYTTTEGFEIKLGECYETRSGRKAFVYKLDADSFPENVFKQVYYSVVGGHEMLGTNTGQSRAYQNTKDDLMRPWKTSEAELTAIVKELREALGLHMIADAYDSTFPDNKQDADCLAKNARELRMRADRLLTDEAKNECHEAAKEYLSNLPEHKAMIKKYTDELWGKDVI